MSESEKTTDTEVTAAAEEAAAEDTSAPAGEAAEPAAEAAAESEAPAEPAAEAPAAEAAADAPSGEAPAEAVASADTAEEAPGEEAAAEETPAAEAPAGEAAAPRVYAYDELKGMTVVQMREIAEGLGEHDELHGYTTMHKEELIVALCKAQGIEAHEHHEVVGIDKAAVKAKIRELKEQRAALIEAGDRKQLKVVRRRIRGLKRKIHKATV